MKPRLAVTVDGQPLPEAEARAFWERFSAHMETHKGDLQGFAKAEGLASVHPALGAQGPMLVASRTAAQRAYVSVAGAHGHGDDDDDDGKNANSVSPRHPTTGSPPHHPQPSGKSTSRESGGGGVPRGGRNPRRRGS